MEQTVNQFSKGLQTDIHPMMQGNDVLSDCLNGTIITMSGNEVALQNDMGNRRVDNAYLPTGYEPVGIKEYGGVIYLALYNPITNKSLLGSFPSPERKINSLDDNSLGGTFEFGSLTSNYTNNSLGGLRCLLSDFIMVPLTSDTSLHAGDKFVVYEGDNGNIYTNKKNISNFDNIIGQKVKSPKNKLYTLYLGVLNSLNEFVDVTKSLVRWKETTNEEAKIIEFNNNESDLIKFNSGYFIAPSFFTNPEGEETKSDAELIKERQTYAANTYAYKLVGPLYLKAQLNHILTFNYNIYGLKTLKNGLENITLWIEANITYNCPDGINYGLENSPGDDNYDSYLEGTSNKESFNIFDLYKRNDNGVIEGEIIPTVDDNSGVVFEECKYDLSTNLYSVKVVKKYELGRLTEIFKYTIGVDSGLRNNNEQLYIASLSSIGEFDPSLIGSGEVKLKTWRFLNNINTKESTITYAFEAYPEYGKSFSDFLFHFTPYTKNDDNSWAWEPKTITIINDDNILEIPNDKIIHIPAQLYNGRVNLYIDWEKQGFVPRTMYKVTWSYKNGEVQVDPSEVRWFLTTELYNPCYNQSLPDGVNDFGNPTENEENILKKYNTIAYKLNANHKGYVIKTLERSEGGILSNNLNEIEIKYTTELNIKINLDYSIDYNKDNYPDYIEAISKEEIPNKINVTPDENSFEYLKNQWENPSYSNNLPSIEDPKLTTDTTYTSTTITGKILNYDLFFSNDLTSDKLINNGFISFREYLHNYETNVGTSRRYGGIGVHSDSLNGPDDGHFAEAYIGNSPYLFYHGSWDGVPDNSVLVAKGWDDGHVTFNYSDVDISSAILDTFNGVNSSVLFLWAYGGSDEYKERNQYFNNDRTTSSGDLHDSNHTRVWWRTSNGTWALFPKLKNVHKTIEEYILDDPCHYNINYYFAYYKQVSLSQLNKFAPNTYTRTREYSTPFTIKWKSLQKSGVDGDLFNLDNPNNANTIRKFFPIYKELYEELDKRKEFFSQCSFEIKTSERFNNIVAIAIGDIYENIDLTSLKIYDTHNNLLNANNLYKLKDGELMIYPDERIGIFDSGNNRLLVYNKTTQGTPEERYDNVEFDDTDSCTSFDYDGVNLVSL